MSCANCGGLTEMTDQSGGVKEGRFVEKYECINCGAWGEISGKAEAPAREWKRIGQVFDEGI